MGALVVRAWQAAYRGVMPDEYLDGLRAEDRAELWRGAIAAVDGRQRLLVAEDDGRVVAFAAFGREAEPSDGDDVGQLYAINVDPAAWGRGIGRSLLAAVTQQLRSDGFASAVLWVVPGNERARALYESGGWTAEGHAREEDVLGVVVEDMRYRRDL